MNALRTIQSGLRAVTLHKLRSTLTMIGIVLGVGSVIVMLAIGQGARAKAVRQLEELGATNIFLRSVKPKQGAVEASGSGVLRYGLTGDDLERIRGTVPHVVAAMPVRLSRRTFRVDDREFLGSLVAVTAEYAEKNRLSVAHGRFLSDLDVEQMSNVAVLGDEAARVLFPMQDPIGRTVQIDARDFYVVIGVVARSGAAAGGDESKRDYDREIYIPFATDRTRFGNVVSQQGGGAFQMEEMEISQITVEVSQRGRVKSGVRMIDELMQLHHGEKDYEIEVPLELLEKAERTERIFARVLGAIASVSLVVGGIGIMNIMLATVVERTREIGIRRALGAKRRDIVVQFLVETVLLSGLGGVLGIVLGVAASHLVAVSAGLETIVRFWTIGLSIVVSLTVGLMFGIYPARMAAELDPIEALRHE